MYVCKISAYLAYAMITYIIGSFYYLIFTRNIGTPFNDSLNEHQKQIKKKSSKQRGTIFCQGLLVGLILCLLFKPFTKC